MLSPEEALLKNDYQEYLRLYLFYQGSKFSVSSVRKRKESKVLAEKYKNLMWKTYEEFLIERNKNREVDAPESTP